MGTNTTTTRRVIAPGLTLAALLATMFLYEWIIIGVVADPAVIEDYHFGSEATVGHGGWVYATPEAYATTALVGGLAALVLVVAFAAAIGRSRTMATAAYTALAVGVIANQMFMWLK